MSLAKVLAINSFNELYLQWLKLTSDDVKEQIFKLAKKGLTPSQIGKITYWLMMLEHLNLTNASWFIDHVLYDSVG